MTDKPDLRLVQLSSPKKERSEECVAKLRALLDDAEAGDIRTVAVVALHSDGEVALTWWIPKGRELAVVGSLQALIGTILNTLVVTSKRE